MLTLRYVAILIVISVSLLTLQYLHHQKTTHLHRPSLAFESLPDDLLDTTNTSITDNNSNALLDNTTSLSPLAKLPWLCDCFYHGSTIPQLLRDSPMPNPDPVPDGDSIPLIEQDGLTIPDDNVMNIINSNLHWPRTLVLTVANYGMRHHVYNWIKSLERTQEERYVVVCLDRALYKHLYKAGYGNHAFVIPDTWSHYAVSNELANYPSHDYRLITFTKTVVVQHILHLDISAFYSDVDVVWKRPKTRDYVRRLMDIRGGNTHVIFQQDDEKQQRINTGFFLMRPTPVMKRFIADTIYIQEQKEKGLWHTMNRDDPSMATTQQAAMNEALARMNLELRTSNVVLLDLFLFPNGHSYFFKQYHQVLGIEPFIVHANYLIGDDKVEKLKEHGLWYLDDSWVASIDESLV